MRYKKYLFPVIKNDHDILQFLSDIDNMLKTDNMYLITNDIADVRKDFVYTIDNISAEHEALSNEHLLVFDCSGRFLRADNYFTVAYRFKMPISCLKEKIFNIFILHGRHM